MNDPLKSLEEVLRDMQINTEQMTNNSIKVKRLQISVGVIGKEFSTPVECIPNLGKLYDKGRLLFSVGFDNGTVAIISLDLET